jgi:hypothetical protein
MAEEGLFNFVVTFFSGWGWQAMGKVPNPVTGKIERNLETAKQIIEIMEMLKEKTKGNLTEDEDKFLTGVIAELQLNYVDEVKKPPVEEKKEEKKEDAPDGEKKDKKETE